MNIWLDIIKKPCRFPPFWVNPEVGVTAWTSDPIPVKINHAAATSLAALSIKALASSLIGSIFSAFPSARVKNHLFSLRSLSSRRRTSISCLGMSPFSVDTVRRINLYDLTRLSHKWLAVLNSWKQTTWKLRFWSCLVSNRRYSVATIPIDFRQSCQRHLDRTPPITGIDKTVHEI